VTALPMPESNIDLRQATGSPDTKGLRTLLEMCPEGRLDAPVAKMIDVYDVADAYREFVSGSRRGRIVLTF
jgi:D-arabinose 1-dehydrogenase-like Zn-dependent alcohol dehydrogenase